MYLSQAECSYSNPTNNEYAGAVDFLNTSTTSGLAIDVYYNASLGQDSAGPVIVYKRLPGLISAAVTSWYRALTGGRPGLCPRGAVEALAGEA